jgi:hypothetical protein
MLEVSLYWLLGENFYYTKNYLLYASSDDRIDNTVLFVEDSSNVTKYSLSVISSMMAFVNLFRTEEGTITQSMDIHTSRVLVWLQFQRI